MKAEIVLTDSRLKRLLRREAERIIKRSMGDGAVQWSRDYSLTYRLVPDPVDQRKPPTLEITFDDYKKE